MPPPTAASKAMSSPAFRRRAEDLAAVHLASSALFAVHDVLARGEGLEDELLRRRRSRRSARSRCGPSGFERSVRRHRESKLDVREVDAAIRLRGRDRRCARARSGKPRRCSICSALSRSRTFTTPVPIVPNPINPTPIRLHPDPARSSLLSCAPQALAFVRHPRHRARVRIRSSWADPGSDLRASRRKRRMPRTAWRMRCLFSTRAKRTKPSPRLAEADARRDRDPGLLQQSLRELERAQLLRRARGSAPRRTSSPAASRSSTGPRPVPPGLRSSASRRSL